MRSAMLRGDDWAINSDAAGDTMLRVTASTYAAHHCGVKRPHSVTGWPGSRPSPDEKKSEVHRLFSTPGCTPSTADCAKSEVSRSFQVMSAATASTRSS